MEARSNIVPTARRLGLHASEEVRGSRRRLLPQPLFDALLAEDDRYAATAKAFYSMAVTTMDERLKRDTERRSRVNRMGKELQQKLQRSSMGTYISLSAPFDWRNLEPRHVKELHDILGAALQEYFPEELEKEG